MNEIQQFCILARTQKSRACSALVQQVLSHRKIFLFSELLSVPSVTELKDTEFSTSFNSLELFAYGTYEEYAADRASFLDLNETQITKLKQLSIVSLAEKSSVITYAELQTALYITDTRLMEDLIIETIYQGLISGKMDPKSKVLRVYDFLSRDVRNDKLGSLIEILKAMRTNNASIAEALQQSNEILKTSRQQGEEEQKETLEEAEKIKSQVKDSLENGADLSSLYKSIETRGSGSGSGSSGHGGSISKRKNPSSSSSRKMGPMHTFGGSGRDQS